MIMLDREIFEFGRRMGMPEFALSASGVAALDVEGIGRLYLERGEDGSELLLYLAVSVPAHDALIPRKALEMCSYSMAHPWPLYSGVHANQLVLLTRLGEREATAASLENAVHFLSQMAAQVA